jgi:hypothetical protein
VRTIWLGLALLPYATLAGIDTWLHERSRKVPRTEQALHAGAAVGLLVFLGAVFSARNTIALCALCAFVVVASADEFGFHAHLAARERRVHFASYLALLAFVLVWQWLERSP